MEKKQKTNQYSPISAVDSLGMNPEKTNWFEQKKKLPRNIRYGLFSQKTEELIKTFCQKYKIVLPEKAGAVSVAVRNFIAGDLSEEGLKKNLISGFQINNTLGISFLDDFKELVIQIKKTGTEEVKKDLVALEIKSMLEKFPEIGEEEIGVHPIVFPGEREENAPTILNWVSDYKLRRGNNQETAILNVGDYLYNSENVKQLNEEEKENLGLILEAFEKNLVVYYNTLFEELDFEIIRLLKTKPQRENKNFNVKKMESKPFHETDQVAPDSVKKEAVDNVSPAKDPQNPKVLDLNKYV